MKHVRVKQPEKPASKSRSERRAGLRLRRHRRIVQRQALHRSLELLVVVARLREQTLEHHRLGLAKRVEGRQSVGAVGRRA